MDRIIEKTQMVAQTHTQPDLSFLENTFTKKSDTVSSRLGGGRLKTLILIPAYNEEKTLGRVITDINRHLGDIPILVIDDGSKDKTVSVAKRHGARVISLPFNSGYGVAIQTGFRYALKNHYSVVVQMDADGQHEASSLHSMLTEIDDAKTDVIIGSRFLIPGNYPIGWVRRIGMHIFATLATWVTHQKVTDPTSGFQAFKGKAIQFVASGYYPPDYPDADFLILLNRSGFRMREIPVKMMPPPERKSMHHGSKSIYYVFKMFLSIFVTLLRQKPKLS